jgi:hypothetical protein
MYTLLYLLIMGRLPCRHEWKTVSEGEVRYGTYHVHSGDYCGRWYYQECKHCGKHRYERLV